MPEVRSVSVHLDADITSYVAKMKLAGAATDAAFGRSDRGIKATNTSLTTTERQLGRVSAAERKLGSDIDNTRVKVDTGTKSIDRYSGRLALFADLILGLGPGLVPILAEAVPLTAAIGTNLVFAGAGLAVVKLGFLGVGDALKAVNKAAIDPTTENIQAMQEALRGLSPEARDFVLQLQGLKPVVTDLRDVAAGGLLPGVGQGLDALLADLPIVRRGVRGISTELGILARDAGQSLASERWQPFLRFVGREAPLGLAVMGRSIGSVTHGVAELIMAFNPLTHDIDRGILRVAQDFDRWASSVGRTKGFQDFLAYLRENGPKVIELLDSSADALLSISQAAAPLGGPVLDALSGVLRVIADIAGSDFGTPLFEAVLLFRLITRTQQLWASSSIKSVRTFVAGQTEAVAAIRTTSAAQKQATAQSAELSALQQKSSAGWATLGKSAARGAAGVAAIGIAASDAKGPLASNTVQFGLMGAAIGGPWGAAVGAGVGLLADFAGGQDKSAAATADFSDTLNQQTGALTKNTRTRAAQLLQEDGALDAAEKLGISTDLLTRATLGHSDAQKQLQAQLDQFTGKTQPQYIAGGRGMYSIDQSQALAAGKLQTEYKTISERIQGNQRDYRQLQRALGNNIEATEHSSRVHRLLQKDLRGERKAAGEAVSGWKLFDNTLDDADKSLSTFIRHMASQAKALEQFGQNALRAARRGLDQGLIKSLRDMGQEGALRLRQLANGSDEQIGRANKAFRSFTGAVDDSKRALTQATSRQWIIKVQNAQALKALRDISSRLNALHDKTIRVTTVRATGGHSVAGDADGGTIPGPRYPYGDKVLRYVAPGEEVISNRHGQADRNRPLLKAINAGRMADGGTVGTFTTRSGPTLVAGDSGLGAAATGATRELQGLQRSLNASRKELDAERERRQQLAQQRQSLVSSVKGGFMSELFATDSPWSSPGSPLSTVRQDIQNARLYRRDIQRLRHRGLSAGVLGTLDTLDEAQAASGLSNRELHELSRLYQVRQRAARAAGVTAGNAAFGDRLGAIHDEIRGTNRRLDKVERAVKQHKDQAHKDSHDAANTNARAISSTAGRVVRANPQRSS